MKGVYKTATGHLEAPPSPDLSKKEKNRKEKKEGKRKRLCRAEGKRLQSISPSLSRYTMVMYPKELLGRWREGIP